MKRLLIFTVCLAITAALKAQDSKGDKKPYVIMIPPWVAMKGNSGDEFTHDMARGELKKWTKGESEFGGKEVVFSKDLETNEEEAGGNSFVADLTDKQADAIKMRFRIPKKGNDKRPHVFVSLLTDFTPIPVTKGRFEYKSKAVNSTDWAAKEVVKVLGDAPLPLTAPQNGIPVLYVVDTGVQPLVPDASTPSQYNWHSELRPAATAGKLRFLQGRVAAGMGASWPKPGATAPWGNASRTVLNFTASNLKPLPPQLAPYNVDPQMDPFGGVGHGTRIAGTALGATVGVLGRFTVGGGSVAVDVQSIRIYPNGSGNAITSTNSAVVSDGIYKAVNDHVARANSSGVASRSVLLFASRSASGFAENVEVALWWAWYKGMIVVVSGGNESGSASNNDMHAPNCLWYASAGVLPAIQPTSPSRFDSTLAATSPQFWPNPTAPGGTPIPPPSKVYLLIAGGNNIAYNGSGGTTGDGNYRPGASVGPDIDISAPSVLVPSMIPGGGIDGIHGTSFSTGFVAGAALAYLAVKATVTASTPDDFRKWLLPAGGPSGAPACATSAWSGWPGPGGHQSHYLPVGGPYAGKVPKLYIQTAPTP